MTSNLIPEEVFWIHEYIAEEYGIPSGFQSKGAVESVLSKIEFLGYGDVCKNGALLLEGLIRLHPFTDGNKRTALQALAEIFKKNGHSFFIPADAPDFLRMIAGAEENDPESTERLVKKIEEWARKNSSMNEKPG